MKKNANTALIKVDTDSELEEMEDFESASKLLLASELENKQLRSLLTRWGRFTTRARAQEEKYLAEAMAIVKPGKSKGES